MRPRALGAVLLLAGASTACATSATPGSERAPRDPHAEVRREIALRPDVPDQWYMAPDVELIGYVDEGDDGVRRDTVRGALQVATWLRSLSVRTRYESEPFHLDLSDVLVCDGAAVERGQYPIPGRYQGQAARGAGTVRYLARWQPQGETWKLEKIWLSPPLSLRANDLASGCTAPPVLPAGLGFGVAIGAGTAADLGDAERALAEEGYGELTATGAGVPEARLWIGYQVSPTLATRLSYGYVSRSRIEGVFTDAVQVRNREVGAYTHVLSLTGEARIAGPVWLGAGPAVAVTRIVSSVIVTTDLGQSETETVDWEVQGGAQVQATTRFPLSPRWTALGSLGYAYFPDLEPNAAPAPVRPRDLSLVLGLEWVL